MKNKLTTFVEPYHEERQHHFSRKIFFGNFKYLIDLALGDNKIPSTDAAIYLQIYHRNVCYAELICKGVY